MPRFLKLNAAYCFAFILAFNSCNKKSDPLPGTNNSSGFDSQRPAMLTNLGTNIIIPSYQLLNAAVFSLDSAAIAFNASPNNTTLVSLQNASKEAYKKWQLCSFYEFGPASQESLDVTINTFPTDTVQINKNIQSGSYNFNSVVNLGAGGFPAIDFLLFDLSADNASILIKYTTDTTSTKRKAYLIAVTGNIKTKINTVLTAWLPTGGNYLHTFVTATGTDRGSSLGLLINAIDFDLDNLKNYEIGIPVGIQSMGTIFPNKVQAYYSGYSSQLTIAHITALEKIYLGNGTEVNDSLGLDDYLVKIGAQYNGGSLNDVIKNQFTSAISKAQLLPDPLSVGIQTNPAPVKAAYTELQKLLVLLKTDMPSDMGVLITYGDTDGD